MSHRKNRIKTVLMLFMAFCGIAGSSSFGAENRLNVLFIMIDDLLPKLGCYGDPVVQSPNIDALAEDGVLFERNYCQQALCTPSRVSILTGCLPDKHFLVGANRRMRFIDPDSLSLPQYFRQQGYITHGVGKIFDGRSVQANDPESWSEPFFNDDMLVYSSETGAPDGNYQDKNLKKRRKEEEGKFSGRQQIQHFKKLGLSPVTQCLDIPDDGYMDGAIANHAVNYLQAYGRLDENKPFFLAVGFRKPHLPFVAPKKYWDLYQPEEFNPAELQTYPEGSPDVAWNNYHEAMDYSGVPWTSPFPEKLQRHLLHGYAAATSYVDTQVGKVVQALKDSGLWDDTVIVLLGDHGFFLGDKGEWGKHSNYEQAVHAPLIIRSPKIPGGTQVGSVSEFVDVFPTVCQLCNVDVPDSLDGKSLVPAMCRPDTNIKPVARSQYERACAMGYAVRDAQYRYVEWREQGADADFGEMTGIIIGTELYDYGNNDDVTKGERRNLADNPEYADILQQMKKKLDEAFPYLPKRTGRLIETPRPAEDENSANLVMAVKNNDLSQAILILDQGASANSFDTNGARNSCLAIAVQNKNISLISVLLEHGANMHQRNVWRQTAWSEAFRINDTEILSLLKDFRKDEKYK